MTFHLIKLSPIYDSIKNAYDGSINVPPLPERKNKPYIIYRRAFSQLIKNVTGHNAVYLWFSHYKNGDVEYIYVGETHKNKQGLKGRLKDEFRRWHHGFWATVFHSEHYLEEAITIFSNKEKYKPKKNYAVDLENNFKKRDATYILYCILSSKRDALIIQNDIIQLLGNPRGNRKDLRKLPMSADELLPISKKIHEKFTKMAEETKPYFI